ncbi:MAG TPA: chorismate synthase [Candidatus Latescibacteria bacterium]|nr:chorismate synthase [Candidatus Handelsmanbacteria bacterium]HIL09673.1 chorismate synthase [Candidatus Latescibacterota bacterium]
MEVLGGPLFGVAGAGESHGPAITTTVLGCPPGLWVERAQVQHYLDRRRPGGNKLGTPRRETDQVALLSGLYAEDHDQLLAGPVLSVQPGEGGTETSTYEAGFTTGEPIAAIVLSAAKRSGDYKQFAGAQGHVRPGHTDLVKHYKSKGFVDVRGGGRSSFRSTVSDVIGGSIARLFLAEHFGTAIFSSICQVGALQADVSLAGRIEELLAEGKQLSPEVCAALEAELEQRELHTVDGDFAGRAAELIAKTRKEKDSLGSAVEIVAVNVPALVGDPIYQSLKLRLMGSLGGMHAVQACEIGAGSAVASRKGSENNDTIRKDGYQQNSHGGLLGGMSTGMPLVCRVSIKPTSSIPQPQDSVRKDLEEIEFQLQKGRHDPCLGVRAGVTLESRLAIELLNAVLMHQARRVDVQNFELF